MLVVWVWESWQADQMQLAGYHIQLARTNIYPIYYPLGHVKRPALQIQSCRIFMAWGKKEGIREESQYESNIDSVVEVRGLEPDQ